MQAFLPIPFLPSVSFACFLLGFWSCNTAGGSDLHQSFINLPFDSAINLAMRKTGTSAIVYPRAINIEISLKCKIKLFFNKKKNVWEYVFVYFLLGPYLAMWELYLIL